MPSMWSASRFMPPSGSNTEYDGSSHSMRPSVSKNFSNSALPRPDHVRAPTDGHPDTEVQASERTRPPVLGTGHTSADIVRRTAPPDTPGWKVRGDRTCIDPGCREEPVRAETRERLATAMELPLDLLAPMSCDCGQAGPLVGEATNGHHFHISPEQHEALQAQQEDGLAKTAWGKCWDRAEALRADLNKAHGAYEALRARVVTTSRYVCLPAARPPACLPRRPPTAHPRHARHLDRRPRPPPPRHPHPQRDTLSTVPYFPDALDTAPGQ
ncbi:hypothetical protein ABVB25_01085 [Streptomyces anthocyanicus]|nr:hypothetical protein [Streptomyces anthocyanicus]